jgi:hypothetical protein
VTDSAEDTVARLADCLSFKFRAVVRQRAFSLSATVGELRLSAVTMVRNGCITTLVRRLSGDPIAFGDLFRALLIAVDGVATVAEAYLVHPSVADLINRAQQPTIEQRA